jgi:uncharacterized membrane protein
MSGVAPENRSRRGQTGDDDEASPIEAIAAGAVGIITLGVAFGLLALGQSYFWVAFPVGFGGGMPLAIGLVRWYESRVDADESTRQSHDETDTALANLRDRYARGELTDEEFENRVERLLETESVADARSLTKRKTASSDDDHNTPESEPAVDTAEKDRQG